MTLSQYSVSINFAVSLRGESWFERDAHRAGMSRSTNMDGYGTVYKKRIYGFDMSIGSLPNRSVSFYVRGTVLL